MATVKVKFRTSSVDRKEGTLYYQVIHNRVVRQISVGYKIYPMEWDGAEGRILFQADVIKDGSAICNLWMHVLNPMLPA